MPARGNAGSVRSHRLLLPGGGRYYWSVQTIDAAFAGSAFAPEATFDFPPYAQPMTATNVTPYSAMLPGYVGPTAIPANVWFEIGVNLPPNQATPLQTIDQSTSGQTIVLLVTNLTPGNTYYYRMVAATAQARLRLVTPTTTD